MNEKINILSEKWFLRLVVQLDQKNNYEERYDYCFGVYPFADDILNYLDKMKIDFEKELEAKVKLINLKSEINSSILTNSKLIFESIKGYDHYKEGFYNFLKQNLNKYNSNKVDIDLIESYFMINCALEKFKKFKHSQRFAKDLFDHIWGLSAFLKNKKVISDINFVFENNNIQILRNSIFKYLKIELKTGFLGINFKKSKIEFILKDEVSKKYILFQNKVEIITKTIKMDF